MSRTRSLVVVSAGLRDPSSTRLLADQLRVAAVGALSDRGMDTDVTMVNLREHGHDATNALLAGFPSPTLQDALDAVSGADGLIAVTPIFNASYNGLFKTFFDVLDEDALAGTPVLMGATSGTARHSLAIEHAMRPMFAYLRAVTVPTAVLAAADDWAGSTGTTDTDAPWADDKVSGPADAANTLAGRINRAVGEFADLIAACPAKVVADPYAEPVPFEQLLAADGRTP